MNRAQTASMASRSAQSAVSITRVRQLGRPPEATNSTSSSSIPQLVGAGIRATSSRRVLPSVSMNTAPGNWLAKVDLPIPSMP